MELDTITNESLSTMMHIDLSNIPLVTPSPPSNTLLVTNLQSPAIFSPPTLQEIRDLISQHAPLHSFAPLKSLRRIVCSFHTVEDAIEIRKLLDGTSIMDNRCRVYFGEPTPIEIVDQHLAAPQFQKQFFISPPPSPPMGWEMRNEDPPNKAVYADDLASALAKLHAKPGARGDLSPVEMDEGMIGGTKEARKTRSGSSTVVYHPGDHGDNPSLPAVTVEDTTVKAEDEDTDMAMGETKTLAHTARPPVELMDCS